MKESLLFLGCVFPHDAEKQIIANSQSSVQMAANVFQRALLEGFRYNLNDAVDIISRIDIGSFPKKYRKLWIRSRHIIRQSGSREEYLGFFNLAIIKHFLRPFGERRAVLSWLKRTNGLRRYVFCYSYSPRYMKIIKKIKRYDSDAVICISINDLPQHIMNNKFGRSLAGLIWKHGLVLKTKKMRKYLDAFMIVSDGIAVYERIPKHKYVTVEAIIQEVGFSESIVKDTNTEEDGLKKVCYTGALLMEYGIKELLASFMSIVDPNYRLLICGDGPLRGAVVAAANVDDRISYLGTLSKDAVQIVQQRSMVLVNPRRPGQAFTAYSFPIKTADYLLAGCPVISYRLEAIPPEYDSFLHYVEGDTTDALRDAIVQVCSLSTEERRSIGKRNRKFILEEKNSVVQTGKILDLLRKNSGKNQSDRGR